MSYGPLTIYAKRAGDMHVVYEIQRFICYFTRGKYIQMPLLHGQMYHDITYDTAIQVVESESDIRIITDIPYLALTGELWGVYCEDFGGNWPRYNATGLYINFCVKDVTDVIKPVNVPT